MQAISLNPTLASGWLSASLTSPLGLFCLALMALSATLVALVAVALHKSRANRPKLARRIVEVFTGDGGTATMEFALVFPVLLFFSLLLAQTTLIMSGNLFVNYSAYMAARSAIVQIPTDKTEEGYESANQYANEPDSPKYRAIQRAAALALLPAAGQIKDAGDDTLDQKLSASVERYYQNYSRTPGNWASRQLDAKVSYALKNTTVTVYQTIPEYDSVKFQELPPEGYTFGPKDPITVRVEHKFSLAFPYVGAIFADGRLDQQSGGGLYSKIAATCTLTNEGIIDGFTPVPTVRNPPSRRN